MIKDNKLSLPEILLLLTGFLILVVIQAIVKSPPVYDELAYLENVALLHQYGFGKNYLLHLEGSAGPLYSMVHFLFEPFTHLKTPYIRWVNAGFLAGIIYVLYLTISLFNFPGRFYSLYIMAIPMVYVTGGLALTEMPALFFFTVAVYLLIKSTTAGHASFLKLTGAGLCMGLAITGRQPYLLTLMTFPVLFITKENFKKDSLHLAVTLISSLVLPCYVFYIWHGLVPTIESQLYKDLAVEGISYRPDFFLFCIFYFAVSMFLIAPGFFLFKYNRRIFLSLAACFIIITSANFKYKWIELIPLKTFSQKILVTKESADLFSNACGSLVIFLSFFFLVCMYKNLMRLQYRREVLFFTLTSLLIAAACIKITWGFSSRYAGQSASSLILLGSFFYKNSKYNMLLAITGIASGIIAIISYLLSA